MKCKSLIRSNKGGNIMQKKNSEKNHTTEIEKKFDAETNNLFGKIYEYNYKLMKKSEDNSLEGKYDFIEIFDFYYLACFKSDEKHISRILGKSRDASKCSLHFRRHGNKADVSKRRY